MKLWLKSNVSVNLIYIYIKFKLCHEIDLMYLLEICFRYMYINFNVDSFYSAARGARAPNRAISNSCLWY